MRRHWHIVAALLALIVGVVAFLLPGRSQEPQTVPPDAENVVPSSPVSSPGREEPTSTPPAIIDPEAAELTQRAINARAVGDIETAITLFERAISINPADVTALTNYGRLLTLTFALDRAIEVLEAAADLQSSDAQAWLDLATAYERAQRFRDSREAQAKAHALVGANTITRDELGRLVIEGTELQ
jgi:tetratricopeptide (TPR) repeat protein